MSGFIGAKITATLGNQRIVAQVRETNSSVMLVFSGRNTKTVVMDLDEFEDFAGMVADVVPKIEKEKDYLEYTSLPDGGLWKSKVGGGIRS